MISSLVTDANLDAIFSPSCSEVNSKQYLVFDQPIRVRLQHYPLFQYILTFNNNNDTVKPLLSGHPQEWANWPLNRGLPKCRIKYGRSIEGPLAHTKPLLLLCYVYHVYNELLKETGHGALIIMSKYPEITHCN